MCGCVGGRIPNGEARLTLGRDGVEKFLRSEGFSK